MDKDFYHRTLIPEIVRYAKLSRMDPDALDEHGAAIFAIWYTQNPLGRPDRNEINNFEEPQDLIVQDKKSAMALIETLTGDKKPRSSRASKKHRGIHFTAHTHPDEPLIPSPDDLSVCDRFGRGLSRFGSRRTEEFPLHFIIDRYLCRKTHKSTK